METLKIPCLVDSRFLLRSKEQKTNSFSLFFNPSSNEPIMNFTTEGCFCPDGMKLFNKESGVCVDKCGKIPILDWIAELITQHPLWIFSNTTHVLTGCLDPDGIPREVRRSFCPHSFKIQIAAWFWGRLRSPVVVCYFSLTRGSSTDVKTASVWSLPRLWRANQRHAHRHHKQTAAAPDLSLSIKRIPQTTAVLPLCAVRHEIPLHICL